MKKYPDAKTQAPFGGIISSQHFWTGIVELPKVKLSLLPALLLFEVSKTFPGNLDADIPVRWDILPILGAGQSENDCYLVQIPLGPQPVVITDLQALIRFARRAFPKKALALIVFARADCFALLPGPEKHHVLFHGSEIELRSVLDPQYAVILYSNEEDAGAAQTFISRLAGIQVQKVGIEELGTQAIASDGLQRDGRRQLKHARRLALFSLALLAVLLGVWSVKQVSDKTDALRAVRAELAFTRNLMQADQSTVQTRDQLVAQVSELEKLVPVELYRLFERFAALLGRSDRILGVRWDGVARSLVIELASQEGVKLLDSINRSGIFLRITSSSMVPVDGRPGFFRFSVTGAL